MASEGHAHDHPHEHPLPEATDLLRARGRRWTSARRRVWEALADEPDAHLTADDLSARLPGVDPSTVYRTLDVFVAEGLARRTDLGDGRSYFEPAHEHLHHHVVCRRCGAVVHIHDEALGDLPARIEAASGYTLGHAELTLVGLCPRCRTR